MQWQEEGIVLGARRYGETGVILDVLTRARGRHQGMVRGGRSLRMQPVLQPGNSVEAVWRGRIEGQLGHFRVEPVASRAGRYLASPVALNGLGLLTELLRLLPEHDPHPALYDATLVVLEHLDQSDIAPVLLVRFELALLAEFGFGLDLSHCALTGATQDLAYVSPRSGRAVSRAAAEPYRDRLLPLPAFLRDSGSGQGFMAGAGHPGVEAVRAAFVLTGHFLMRDLFRPRETTLPDARTRLLALLV
ncbi:DNA repair protein RecO [Pseudochelatococcus contaminans]|uniref:DNA repair protein RecO n=1 Tax=Pseudochelatococcus contaminans TaxID=1538103 RepID=A0A7W6EIS2_9HYPH|nr:DNA repair protein RecO [Pseudochelatococcus contaminans]MBB3811341.1 DNA repair protein RecO (recombination protein O) [Pseudochelatococcus contaminans]